LRVPLWLELLASRAVASRQVSREAALATAAQEAVRSWST